MASIKSIQWLATNLEQQIDLVDQLEEELKFWVGREDAVQQHAQCQAKLASAQRDCLFMAKRLLALSQELAGCLALGCAGVGDQAVPGQSREEASQGGIPGAGAGDSGLGGGGGAEEANS